MNETLEDHRFIAVRSRKVGRSRAPRTHDVLARKPAGALATIFQLLPHLHQQSGEVDFAGSPAGVLEALAANAQEAIGAINRGISAIGFLIADSSPEINDGTIHQETVEALGWLLSELGELGGACVVLSGRCRATQQRGEKA
jgi:hypothetical protein